MFNSYVLFEISVPSDRYSYRPRPGIVLDDTLDYTGSQGLLATYRPFTTHRHPQIGDIFDVTVSAIQGPGGSGGTEPVRVPVNIGGGGGSNNDVIITSAAEGQGFVSIDGKRKYLDFIDKTEGATGTSAPPPVIQPTRTQTHTVAATG